jgi:hypothetical protein
MIMSNSVEAAERWTRFLASRAYVPRAPLILQHYASGQITRLCDCGCQSYDIAIADNVVLAPLMPASDRGGCALELDYHLLEPSNPGGTVTLRLFVDRRGYLSGLDADYCSNSSAMPEHVVLVDPPFHAQGAYLNDDMTSNQRLERP